MRDIVWNPSEGYLKKIFKVTMEKSIIANVNILRYNFGSVTSKDSAKIFLRMLENDTSSLTLSSSYISFFQNVSNNKEVIKESSFFDSKVSDYMVSLNNNKKIYSKILEFKKLIMIKYKESFDSQDYLFINKIMENYKKNGLHLNNESHLKLQNIKKHIKLNNDSIMDKLNHENMLEIIISDDDINKLPGRILSILNDNSSSTNKIEKVNKGYRIKIDSSICKYLIDNCENESMRQKIESENFKKYDTLSKYIVNDIILKREYSNLLNYPSYLSYVTQDHLIKDPRIIRDHLYEILIKMNDKYEIEVSDMKKIKKEINNNDNLTSSDISFCSLNLKKSHFQQIAKKNKFSDIQDEIKEHFEINNTITEMFKICSEMFSVNFTKINVKTWDKNVKCYEISNEKIIGYLFLDLFSSKCAYGDVYCYNIIQGFKNVDPIICMMGNLGYQLLNYQDVSKLFREMGHVIHAIFGRTKYITHCGTNVPSDFIQIPPQILEEVCWDRNIIKRISRHHSNNKKISNNLIEKIILIKNSDVCLSTKKHIYLSFYEQMIYSSDVLFEMLKRVQSSSCFDGNEVKKEYYKNVMREANLRLHLEVFYNNIYLNDGSFFLSDWIDMSYQGDNDGTIHTQILSKVFSLNILKQITGKNKNISDNLKNIGDAIIENLLIHGNSVNLSEAVSNIIGNRLSIQKFLNVLIGNKNKKNSNNNNQVIDYFKYQQKHKNNSKDDDKLNRKNAINKFSEISDDYY